MKTILTNCTVIDCTGKPSMQDMTVVIEMVSGPYEMRKVVREQLKHGAD